MRTVVHLSDLHFGRTDPDLLAPLARQIAGLQPHLVVVSGDLTQRARSSQFEEARRFLDTLPRPQVVVPGNHDIPLYNVLGRFVAPLRRFRSIISHDLHPEYIDDEIAVVGVNTARSLTFKDGRINARQMAHVQARLCGLDDHLTKIIVTHHPFDLPEGFHEHEIVGRAPDAMRAFLHCGADLMLSGHLHASGVASSAANPEIR